MINSKALKPLEDKKVSRLYSWWINTAFARKYYGLLWTIKKPFLDLKKMVEWYWNVFRYDYDFDGSCLFRIIEYKLKRVQKVLENGHAIQDAKDMQALRIAIKVAGRLSQDNYSDRAYRKHDVKWGEYKHWFTPNEHNPEYSTWNSSRANAVTEEQKAEERADRKLLWAIEEMQQQRDERRLYGILQKYLRRLWD